MRRLEDQIHRQQENVCRNPNRRQYAAQEDIALLQRRLLQMEAEFQARMEDLEDENDALRVQGRDLLRNRNRNRVDPYRLDPFEEERVTINSDHFRQQGQILQDLQFQVENLRRRGDGQRDHVHFADPAEEQNRITAAIFDVLERNPEVVRRALAGMRGFRGNCMLTLY